MSGTYGSNWLSDGLNLYRGVLSHGNRWDFNELPSFS